jgi:hypothetical protein
MAARTKNDRLTKKIMQNIDQKLAYRAESLAPEPPDAAERARKLAKSRAKAKKAKSQTPESLPARPALNERHAGTSSPGCAAASKLHSAYKRGEVLDVSQFPTLRPLTDTQKEFIRLIAQDGYSVNSARGATGMSYDSYQRLMARSDTQELMKKYQAEYRELAKIRKSEVLDGFKEAIDMAKLKGEPLTMIAGWREIGRLCGYYEPTKTEVNINVSGQLMLDRMSTLSDEQLLEMMNNSKAVDVEFEDITEQESEL